MVWYPKTMNAIKRPMTREATIPIYTIDGDFCFNDGLPADTMEFGDAIMLDRDELLGDSGVEVGLAVKDLVVSRLREVTLSVAVISCVTDDCLLDLLLTSSILNRLPGNTSVVLRRAQHLHLA